MRTRFKYIHRMIAGIVVISLILLSFKALNYAIYDDTHIYTRVMMHEFYSQDEMNILCLGSSHCYRGIDPTILDKELGKHSFNGSTSSQIIDGSYTLLQEALDNYEIETVVLDLSYSSARQKVDKKDRSAEDYTNTATFLISDYLQNPIRRAYYLVEATDEDRFGETFFMFRRTDFITGLKGMRKVLENKSQSTYKEYLPQKYDEEEYVTKGFVANYHIASETEYEDEAYYSILDTSLISSKWKEYLNKMISLCEEKNIRLVIINIPEPMYLIYSYGDYDKYIEFVNEIISGKNVEYYNFNLLNECLFPDDRTLFKDNNHLNYYGAEKFSVILASILNCPELFKDITYSSARDKLFALGFEVK